MAKGGHYMTPAQFVIALHLIAGQPQTYQFKQAFWQHYDVTPQQILPTLLKQHLVQVSHDALVVLPQQTVAALKVVLRRQQLKISGRKAELVARLAAVTPDQWQADFPQGYYQVTPAGQTLLTCDTTSWWVHCHYFPGIIDFEQAKRQQLPAVGLSETACVAQLLTAANTAAQTQGDFAQQYLVQHLRFQAAWAAKQPGQSLLALLRCVDFELAGVSMCHTQQACQHALTPRSFDYRLTYYKVEAYYSQCFQQLMVQDNLDLTDILAAYATIQDELALPAILMQPAQRRQVLAWTLTQQGAQLATFYQELGRQTFQNKPV
jgi:hypothetical protein